MWCNTGGNGPASEVWTYRAGDVAFAEIQVMPYRCLATLWVRLPGEARAEPDEDHDGIPYPRKELESAKALFQALADRIDARFKGR